MSFGGDTKSRRSLLSGVYARGSKRPHQSALECVTVVDSTAHSKNSPRSASMRRKTLPCTEKGRRRRRRSCGIRLQNKFAVRKVNTLHQPSRKIKATRLLCGKNLRRFFLTNRKLQQILSFLNMGKLLTISQTLLIYSMNTSLQSGTFGQQCHSTWLSG